MPPPPTPWFRGRSISMSETEGMLTIEAMPGHVFHEPRDTFALYLPAETLVVAIAEGASMAFHGDFAKVGRPRDVMLAPVDPDDADRAVILLRKRLELPRIPRVVDAATLCATTSVALVSVEGTFTPARGAAPNFEGMLLDQDLEPGRYRVMGFFHPEGPRPAAGVRDGEGPGPRLHALSVTPL